jgi:hypothetical protein
VGGYFSRREAAVLLDQKHQEPQSSHPGSYAEASCGCPTREVLARKAGSDGGDRPTMAVAQAHPPTLFSWAVRRLGITPGVVAWAGHSSPAMMARSYAHALPPGLTEVTAELDAFAAEAAA